MEIEHHVLANLSNKQLTSEQHLHATIEIVRNKLPRYLFNRVKSPLDDHPGLLNNIKELRAYLHRELPILEEDQLLADLCSGLSKIFSPDLLLEKLWGCSTIYARTDITLDAWVVAPGALSTWDEIVATIAVGAYDVTRRVLMDNPGALAPHHCRWNILEFGIVKEDQEILDVIAAHLASLDLIKEPNRTLQRQYLAQVNAPFGIEGLLQNAIQEEDDRAVRYLVDLYLKIMPYPKNEFYTTILRSVLDTRSIENLEHVLSMPRRKSWRGTKSAFSHACALNHHEAARLMLDKLDINLNKGTSYSMPLFAAIRSNAWPTDDVVIVKEVLRRSNPNTVNIRLSAEPVSWLIRIEPDVMISPIDVAVACQNVPMVKLLLANGAHFPDIRNCLWWRGRFGFAGKHGELGEEAIKDIEYW